MLKLISTDSYFNLFKILNDCLKDKVNTLSGNNVIFCEEKVSLMAERIILSEYGGSFNTAVYSFGNYLRAKMPEHSALTKEGSAMAVKRILSYLPLSCFKASRANLAPSLYELIIQLKSAKVTPQDLKSASLSVSGVLKNKLTDISEIYKAYEDFIVGHKFDDQSSMLSYLPKIIENDDSLIGAQVFIVGFNGWTSQLRAAISSLVKKAQSVTAILTEGENGLVYVNETVNAFREIARLSGQSLKEKRVLSDFTVEGKAIVDGLFNPLAQTNKKMATDKIYALTAENRAKESARVAEIIRGKIVRGECRFRDITLAVPDLAGYRDDLVRAFTALEIPFFLDEKKKVDSHPLLRLILSYIDATRKNLSRKELSAFYKNPLFCQDKGLCDEFENYTLATNVDYTRIKKEFTLAPKGAYTLEQLNEFRQSVCKCFEEFNVPKLLENLGVEQKLIDLSEKLSLMGETEESAVNDQIYSATQKLLADIDLMLGGIDLPLSEYRNVFLSGVYAMELSIIPQYNDAVFVGGLKQTALAKAKHLFVLGLTAEVPAVKEDVALLTDGDLSALEEIKVLVEPKIKVVNHRERECLGLALSAFSQSLYISYPLLGVSGDKNSKSQAFSMIEQAFTCKPFPRAEGYLTRKEGLNAFARACGDFATGKIEDFSKPSSYFSVVGEAELKPLLDRSNQEVKIRLESSREILDKKYISPTRIEDYYKCPYRAFLSSGLKLRPREQGVVDGFSIGNIMHEIFGEYAKRIYLVRDKQSSDLLVNEIVADVLKKQEYSRYLDDAQTRSSVMGAIEECSKFCYKNYLALKNSKFKVKNTEAGFGDKKDCAYPAIDLLGGSVKMTGKIDRVDESESYYRILDYKTASTNADLDLLFTGKKLQLYLYAAAVGQNKDKSLAGVYYMPVSDKYRKQGDKEPALSKGLTLNDSVVIEDNGESEFLAVKDGQVEGQMTKQALSACVKYALEISELAVSQMKEGFIPPSPGDERVCGYCDYRALCSAYEPVCRTHGAVDADTIIDCVREKE